MKVLGDDPFAMRLPGVGFVLLGMLATYWLGRRLFGPAAGLIGAFVLGFAPLGVAIAQGYAFGDITDTPVIGLAPVIVLAAVKGWQTGRYRWLLLAGVAQWTLYLTKSTLGLAPAAVVVALFLADLLFPAEDGWRRPGVRGLAVFLGTTLALVVPSYLYFSLRFPATMKAESASWRTALLSNYERWGAPVDFHLTFYLYLVYGAAFALLIAAALAVCSYLGLVRRSRSDLVILVWFAAIYLPLTVAVTKSPPLPIAALGATGLAVGRFISLVHGSTRRYLRAVGYGILASAAVLCVLLLAGIRFGQQSLAHELSPSRTLVLTDIYGLIPRGRWVPYLILAVFAVAIAGIGVLLERSRLAERLNRLVSGVRGRQVPLWTLVVTVTVAVAAGYLLYVDQSYVRHARYDAGPEVVLGPYLRDHTPADATIFIDRAGAEQDHANLAMMFWSHRDAYLIPSTEPAAVCDLVPKAAAVDSTPVLLTVKPYAGPSVAIGTYDDWYVYRLVPCS
jgi:4-amino-4-deoxy-L-arabinose transferase-like glycosyltransferase